MDVSDTGVARPFARKRLMRAAIAFLLCLFLGLISIVIPPTIFWFRWTYELVGERNLAWGLVIGVTIGIVVGATAGLCVRGPLGLRWLRGAALALATGLIVGVSSTALAYWTIAIFPEPLMQAPQGPFWIFHPGTYLGLLATASATVAVGQLAGPPKRNQRGLVLDFPVDSHPISHRR